ncbi:MAG: neutral/alkaline non-lysosomal ceramidase N-terminal domain-containing protein [Zavarzinella sp.]
MKNKCILMLVLAATWVFSIGNAAEYRAGVAKATITPTKPLWMAGYASRTEPCTKTHHDLWVKCLALEDERGHRQVMVTLDLCGIPRSFRQEVLQAIQKKVKLEPGDLVLNASHTHSGPVVRDNLVEMYPMNAQQLADVLEYSTQLVEKIAATVIKAFDSLESVSIQQASGVARFAVNRRENKENKIILGANPQGPVEHSVPILAVYNQEKKLIAVCFGYACHNTTLSFNEWCGDYAGFAQIELEKKLPGVTALFWIGCGADANPLPRRKLEYAVDYGKQLSEAVCHALKSTTPVTAACETAYEEIALSFDTIPGKAQWQQDATSKTLAVSKRAQRMLKLIEGEGIPQKYPYYPIQSWRFGNQLTWVFLGGEVVVDYHLRLKKELKAHSQLWVAGYCNDVMAYIPSKRILKEGGYEADSSQIYYGMPAKWSPTIEDQIISTIRKQVK